MPLSSPLPTYAKIKRQTLKAKKYTSHISIGLVFFGLAKIEQLMETSEKGQRPYLDVSPAFCHKEPGNEGARPRPSSPELGLESARRYIDVSTFFLMLQKSALRTSFRLFRSSASLSG